MFRQSIICLALVLPVAAANPSFAFEIDRVFGHSIAVQKDSAGQTLTVDGRELLKAATIRFDDVGMVAGVRVLIGASSTHDQSCAATHFVISFPLSGKPRIDGPLGTCDATSYEIGPSQLNFETTGTAEKERKWWIWSTSYGMTKMNM